MHGRTLAAAQRAFEGTRIQRIGVFTGECDPLHRPLPQAPVLADLPWAEGQISPTGARVLAVALDFVAGERAASLWIERMQTNQHLIHHLFVAKRLQQARVVAGQVDHQIGAAFDRRLYPQHAQTGIAENLARQSCTAFPHRRLEFQQQLVAPAVVGGFDRRLMLCVQCRRQLNLGQGAQGHGQHCIVGAVAHRSDLHGHAILVLHDGRDRCVGFDGFQLLDEGLCQHWATAGQARSTQVAVADVPIDTALLCEIQQRQTRRLIVARTDLLVHQLTRSGRQLQLVQPAGHGDLVECEQRAVGCRVQRIVDRARQVVQRFLVTLERFGGRRLLERQVTGAEVFAVDEVARRAHVFRRGQGIELEAIDVGVQCRLSLGIADPLTGR